MDAKIQQIIVEIEETQCKRVDIQTLNEIGTKINELEDIIKSIQGHLRSMLELPYSQLHHRKAHKALLEMLEENDE